MLGEISTGLNLRVMKQGQDVKTSPPPSHPSWQTLCCVVVLKNPLWGQNLSLQHVALNSAGLSLCVMKQGHDAEASPLIWLDFMKRFLVLGDKIFTPQHVAAWNSAGLNLCVMKRVHDDHIWLALSLPQLLLHPCPGFYHITVKYVG